MIQGMKRANEITQDRMKICLVGAPKVGKDWFANTAPGRIFTFDFDDRFDALQKHPNRANIEGKTYYDEDPQNPHAWVEFEADVAEFQEMKARGEPIPDWFVMSSMQFVSDMCQNYILYNNPGLRLEITESRPKNEKRGSSKGSGKTLAFVPFGWEPYNSNIECIKTNINALHSIGNLICVYHEAPEKDKTTSTPEKPVYTGKLSVQPANLQKLIPLFNDMLRVKVVNNQRVVITDCSDYQFDGATSMLLDSEEEADLTKMLAKHKERLSNG